MNTPGNWTVSVPDNRIVVIPDVACRLRVNSIVEKIDKIGSIPVNHFTESLDDNFDHFLGVLLFKTLKGKTMTNPCSDTIVPRILDIGEGTSSPIYDELLPYWLGFPTLNALDKMRNDPREGIFDENAWISRGMSEKEALECCIAISSYSFVE